MSVPWPTTKTGKRLAGCPGSLPLGGEQERLPDGSLTELRSMQTHEIAVAIEREAVAALVPLTKEALLVAAQTGQHFPALNAAIAKITGEPFDTLADQIGAT